VAESGWAAWAGKPHSANEPLLVRFVAQVRESLAELDLGGMGVDAHRRLLTNGHTSD
jgi:hypothetical protein